MHPTEEALRRAIDTHTAFAEQITADDFSAFPRGLITRVQVLAEFLDEQLDPRANGYAVLLRALTDGAFCLSSTHEGPCYLFLRERAGKAAVELPGPTRGWLNAAAELLGWRATPTPPRRQNFRVFLPDNYFGDPFHESFSNIIDALAQTAPEFYQ